MNILFFPYNAYAANEGGIARITCTLIEEFRHQGNFVIKVGHKKNTHSVVSDEYQFFLPDVKSVNTIDNLNYMVKLCEQYSIDFIIFQFPLSADMLALVVRLKQNVKAKVISCLHNSVLTPVYNYPYVREYELKRKGKNWLFELLKTQFVKKIITRVYILKYRNLFRNILKSSDAVTVLCNGQLDELKKMCGMDTMDNVHVIPNCIFPINNEYSNVEKEKVILWAGAFDCNIKRPDLMLLIWEKIYNKHPDWKLLMLGDGPAFKDIKAFIENKGIHNVELTGRVNPHEYMSKGKILCVTSTHESFSLVTLEAMTHEVVAVAFDSFTSARLLIHDGVTGRLVKPFDVDMFANVIDELINCPEGLNKMAHDALKASGYFMTNNIYPLWENLFIKLQKDN